MTDQRAVMCHADERTSTIALEALLFDTLLVRRRSKLRFVLALVAVLLGVGGCESKPFGASANAVPAPSPNVLLVSIDSLRADHVQSLGYQAATTPKIDELAGNGALFTAAVSSSSWTLPAHASLLTGLSTAAHRVHRPRDRLNTSIPTLAEALSQKGYSTTGLYAGPFLHPEYGLARGFDNYLDCTAYELGRPEAVPSKLHGASHRDVTNERIFDRFSEAVSVLDPEKPFFLFVHMWDVHYDYIPPESYVRQFDPDYTGKITGRAFMSSRKISPDMPARDFAHVLARYDGEIRYTDDTLARMLNVLAARGDLENTLIVVTSDHGDEFFEHGRKGHRLTLFDEVIRVPLVISLPSRIAAAEIDHDVELSDIAPTVLDYAGAGPLPAATGRSLRPLLEGRGDAVEFAARGVVSELHPDWGGTLLSFRRGGEKLIWNGTTADYYDLKADPDEQNPLALETSVPGQQMLAELKQRVAAHREQAAGLGEEGAVSKPNAATEQQLRTLGYIE